MSQSGFHIHYESPSLPLPEPDIPEDYDFGDAFADHVDCGACATLIIGADELRMTGGKFMDLFDSSVLMAEALRSLPAEEPGGFRDASLNLPSEMKVYSWLFSHFVMWLPVIVFATDGAEVRVYTRIRNEDRRGPRLIILPHWGHEDPVIVPRLAVLEELRGFVARYLDDLVEAMPFIADDDKYREYRRRMATLRLEKPGA